MNCKENFQVRTSAYDYCINLTFNSDGIDSAKANINEKMNGGKQWAKNTEAELKDKTNQFGGQVSGAVESAKSNLNGKIHEAKDKASQLEGKISGADSSVMCNHYPNLTSISGQIDGAKAQGQEILGDLKNEGQEAAANTKVNADANVDV